MKVLCGMPRVIPQKLSRDRQSSELDSEKRYSLDVPKRRCVAHVLRRDEAG